MTHYNLLWVANISGKEWKLVEQDQETSWPNLKLLLDYVCNKHGYSIHSHQFHRPLNFSQHDVFSFLVSWEE